MKIGLIGLLFPVLLDKVVYGYTSRILPDADMAEFKRKHKQEYRAMIKKENKNTVSAPEDYIE